uniref:Carboxypeptidase B2 n=1 Tax=Pseudonaja textilis TaxID=8673 RepID=A0A670YEV0_PSETE
MDEIARRHPDIVQKIHIGYSFDKRPLYVLKFSHRSRTPKNAIWIDCGIHAREWVSPACCLWFTGHVTQFLDRDVTMARLLQRLDFYVMPIMNVDGYEYTWTTNRMWRKNRSKHGNNKCIGTDLNRNFDAGWCGKMINDCEEIYCGPYPESEPEVKAMVNFLRKRKDRIKAYLTMHSYSQMVLFPYSYTKNLSKDHDELVRTLLFKSELKRAFANWFLDLDFFLLKGVQRHFFKKKAAMADLGSLILLLSLIDLAPGGSDDWAYDQGIKYSFTFELRDQGRYGFLLPQHLIKPTCYEAITGIKIIASHVINNISKVVLSLCKVQNLS